MRYAARIAVETQPLAQWENKVLSEKDPITMYWTKDPLYKDFVLVDAAGKEMRIPTEHMLSLIEFFAKHLHTQKSI